LFGMQFESAGWSTMSFGPDGWINWLHFIENTATGVCQPTS
jgi:hypothetical protein